MRPHGVALTSSLSRFVPRGIPPVKSDVCGDRAFRGRLYVVGGEPPVSSQCPAVTPATSAAPFCLSGAEELPVNDKAPLQADYATGIV